MLDLTPSDIAAGWASAHAWVQWGVDSLVAWQTRWGVVAGAGALFSALTLWAATGLPGASVLILAIGALYGWWWGTVLVSVASTLGATLAFAAARWGLRASLRQRHAAQLARLDRLLVQRGPWVLVMLRVAPVIPFPLLNPLMGLTTMRALPFFAWSYVGMLGGTVVWVVVGQGIGRSGLGALADPRLWLLVAMLGVAMWWASRVSRRWLVVPGAGVRTLESLR